MLQNVIIRTSDRCLITLSIDSEDKVKDIKHLLDNLYKEKRMLLSNGAILNEEYTLAQSNIKDYSVLDMAVPCYGGFQIFVKTFSGKSICMEVDGKSTVTMLKNRIYKDLGYPPANQRLLFGGNELQGPNTLDQYQIPADAAIYIVGRVLGGV